MGSGNFYMALGDYLNTYKFRTSIAPFLLDKLDFYTDAAELKPMMETWIYQSGYPVISIEEAGDSKYTITQKRFLSNQDETYIPDESPYK